MGAGQGATDADVVRARRLGELVAREGWVLLTGGRNEGVMQAANAGAKTVEGSLTIGILPTTSTVGVSPHVDVAICTGMGSARNNINVLSSDVVMACGPGGPGTVSEIALALKAGKPVIVIGADDAAQAFLTEVARGEITFASSPEDAITQAKEWLR